MTDKTIWLGRHSEGVHNILRSEFLADPGLTARGREQCRKLDLETQGNLQTEAEVIMSSPLR